MRQIVLASKSKARKALLKRCGFKFKVAVSGAKEINPGHRRSIKKTVIRNALFKAGAVLAKFKSGVVIGADTVVSQDKFTFGKPKNKKDAFLMIKKFSLRPSYVYTGIAVIDMDSGKTYTDCACTKIWMVKMSNEDIRKYLSSKAAQHLSFAGGFDIQGRGSLFIERIDGCFYNVVGLPLAKLYKLLKKCGIEI